MLTFLPEIRCHVNIFSADAVRHCELQAVLEVLRHVQQNEIG